jgi:NADH dehydrogenase/NADH:ubiquinone oxidoreductase subunit G
MHTMKLVSGTHRKESEMPEEPLNLTICAFTEEEIAYINFLMEGRLQGLKEFPEFTTLEKMEDEQRVAMSILSKFGAKGIEK